jgi:hypothetical protein
MRLQQKWCGVWGAHDEQHLLASSSQEATQQWLLPCSIRSIINATLIQLINSNFSNHQHHHHYRHQHHHIADFVQPHHRHAATTNLWHLQNSIGLMIATAREPSSKFAAAAAQTQQIRTKCACHAAQTSLVY